VTPEQRRLYGDVALMLWLGVMLTLLAGAYFGVV
jgi:hypothetical protein